MNEQKTRSYQEPDSEAESRERRRNARLMRELRVKRQKNIMILSAVMLLIVILALIIGLKGCGADTKLTGLWKLDDTVSYQFEKDGTGAMILSNSRYDFTFKNKGDSLYMDYEEEYLMDGSYTFLIKGETLVLIGGEGTSGGTYELQRQHE